MMGPTRYCAVDIETTGLEALAEDIVEVGAVAFLNGQPTDRFVELIRPAIPIPEDAIAVHGITDAMVAGCPTTDEGMPRLVEFLGDDPIVIHHAPFDTPFLLRDFFGCGLAPAMPVIDTCELAPRILKNLKRKSLDAVCGELGIAIGDRHRSEGDAEATGRALWAMLGRLPGGAAWEFELLASESPPLRPFRFDDLGCSEAIASLPNEAPRGSRVEIAYNSSGGQLSTRKVGVEYYHIHRGKPYLIGQCDVAGARRSFRFDRIEWWKHA